jgi:hypothetical protein
MTAKYRQLVLEVMLLRERYSDREIAEASQAFSNRNSDPVFRDIENMLGFAKPREPSTKKAQGPSVNIEDRKRAFIDSLDSQNRKSSNKRLEMVARRLGVELSYDNRRRTIASITTKLNKMDPKDLEDFLRPYKIELEADQGYMNLATFILNKDGS